MVGAVLVQHGRIIGRGWHRRAGLPHAEIEALQDAERHGHSPRGATLYVTLEPCCTHGRTPPCTDAIQAAGIRRVVVGATDPNPKHAGKGLDILKRAGIAMTRWGEAVDEPAPGSRGRSLHPSLARECAQLNEAFNHWIVRRTPFVTVKAAMTLDGKIATTSGESKWITGEKSRAFAMRLRQGSDAVLVGINTVLADDPSLTARAKIKDGEWTMAQPIRRIVLDARARTPLAAKVVSDEHAALTTIVVGKAASKRRVAALAKRVRVIRAPERRGRIALAWLLRKLGAEDVTHLLVEGGGEVNAAFLLGRLAHRVAFFYAPKILGGRHAWKAVAGKGARSWNDILRLNDLEWRRLGSDLMLTAKVVAT